MDRQKTVLVVDDEAHITHIVAFKLRQAGFAVVTAGNGQEGLEAARSTRPDIVVTDFQMPLVSGFELSVRLRADPITARIPVLMITARGHMLSAEEVGRTNIRAVMCKPFSPRQVCDKIREILGIPEQAAGSGRGAAAA